MSSGPWENDSPPGKGRRTEWAGQGEAWQGDVKPSLARPSEAGSLLRGNNQTVISWDAAGGDEATHEHCRGGKKEPTANTGSDPGRSEEAPLPPERRGPARTGRVSGRTEGLHGISTYFYKRLWHATIFWTGHVDLSCFIDKKMSQE